jgi:hypothetical protein
MTTPGPPEGRQPPLSSPVKLPPAQEKMDADGWTAHWSPGKHLFPGVADIPWLCDGSVSLIIVYRDHRVEPYVYQHISAIPGQDSAHGGRRSRRRCRRRWAHRDLRARQQRSRVAPVADRPEWGLVGLGGPQRVSAATERFCHSGWRSRRRNHWRVETQPCETSQASKA